MKKTWLGQKRQAEPSACICNESSRRHSFCDRIIQTKKIRTGNMKIFRHHSAQARCHPIGSHGLAKVEYSGPLSDDAFDVLAPQVRAATHDANAIMFRMDGCLLMMAQRPAPSGRYQVDSPPACVIVSPGQYDYWVERSAMLAKNGIRRVVFLTSQLPLALLWLERRSSRRALPIP